MRAKLFEVDKSGLPQNAGPAQTFRFTIPGLSAYAVSSAVFIVNGISAAIEDNILSIQGDELVAVDWTLEQDDDLKLQVYYYGIRDYSLLFPSILAADQARAERVGRFYEEADHNFEAGAWMSFMLMSAAIFEHILYFKLGMPNKIETLDRVTRESVARNIISPGDAMVVDNTRDARNAIHCNRMNLPYITRKDAMDARVLIEKLISKL